jgi:hypothetical protein
MRFQNTKQKPQLGARINHGHPFARKLELDLSFLEASVGRSTEGTAANRPSGPAYENTYDLVKGIPAGFYTNGTPSGHPRWYGNGVRSYYSEANRVLVTNANLPDALFLGAVSVILKATIHSVTGTFQVLVNKTNTPNGDGSNPLYLFLNATNQLTWIRSNTGNYSRFTGPTVSLNKPQTLAVAASSLIQTTPSIYIDGVKAASLVQDGGGTGAPTGAGEPLRIFSPSPNQYVADCTLEYIRLYSRELSSDEISWMTDEPYAHLIYPSTLHFFSQNPFITASYEDTLSLSEEQQLGLGLIYAEDAANLADDAGPVLGYELSASDNLNNWSDVSAYTLFEIALALSQAVADSTQKLTGPASSRFEWKDGIVIFLDAADTPLFVSIDDLDSFNDDDVQISFAIFFNDAGGGLTEAYDSMMYNWADAISFDLTSGNEFGDSMLPFQDLADVILDHLLPVSDTLALSDAFTMSFNIASSGSDTMSMSDAVSIYFIVSLEQGIFDSMDYWDDFQRSTTGASRTQYLRRYVNDVING